VFFFFFVPKILYSIFRLDRKEAMKVFLRRHEPDEILKISRARDLSKE